MAADSGDKMADNMVHSEGSVELCDVSLPHTEDNTHLYVWCFRWLDGFIGPVIIPLSRRNHYIGIEFLL